MSKKKVLNNKTKEVTNKMLSPNSLVVLGIVCIFIAITLFLAQFSFLLNWETDQTQIYSFLDKNVVAENILGKLGAFTGDLMVYKTFGISSFLIALYLLFIGIDLGLKKKYFSFIKYGFILFFALLWIPVFITLLLPEGSIYGGVFGYESYLFLSALIGKIGIICLLFFSFLILLTVSYSITPQKITNNIKSFIESFKKDIELSQEDSNINEANPIVTEVTPESPETETKSELTNTEISQETEKTSLKTDIVEEKNKTTSSQNLEIVNTIKEVAESSNLNLSVENKEKSIQVEEASKDISDFEIQAPIEEEQVTKNLADKIVQEYGEYDPHADLSMYQYLPIDLLKDYKGSNITINQMELEENKEKIVEVLKNFKIEISKITATIGPTVTLYEIVPEAGVRISKIKNLEDDIALSLSALGIRIIAPIPGRGTIGIEVPSSNPNIVSMRSVIASNKFQISKMELPIAFGKTISNETYVVDLVKMPHLLMAGATGQGKSVGLNTIIASLLYKKHPSELKFVLVDPKKVELTLYNKIERHYLAKLPDSEEAIITDNTKVIHTINSLCIEMDNRYELLKKALVRNLKEYNRKFKQRKLNPENGHQFLPYIVLIIDEFADLIMTAGKEVEMPVARLAQLARAVGIHLIVATQRPSVNVITGLIKSNFPARVAFRVTSKIDSRTILDTSGADQLIGKGDMLYSNGNDIVRLQCAFVDTPEVEKIVHFIGEQKGYADAHLLPEYVGEDGNSSLDIDLDDRDVLFEDAARVLVLAQQGSASLLQRKLKLGYNRAGRIIDQLEAAGVVGPFEGSKARQVLIPDDLSLEQLLDNLKKK